MGAKTSIQWTDASWNPTRGCSRVSEGCRNCYAERIAARFAGPGLPYEGLARHVLPLRGLGGNGEPRWTGKVELIPEKLDEPLRWRPSVEEPCPWCEDAGSHIDCIHCEGTGATTRPKRIFVNSMSDLFHEALPDEDIDQVFAAMGLAEEHTFQVLTKRPKRLREYVSSKAPDRIYLKMVVLASERIPGGLTRTRVDWPLPNVWLGVSCEDQATADERIPLLLQTPAAVRFVSLEPLLGPVDIIQSVQRAMATAQELYQVTHASPIYRAGAIRAMRAILHWVICGGESGPAARPCDVAWIRSIRDQCRAAGVACFIKQLGTAAVDAGLGIAGRSLAVTDDGAEIMTRRLRHSKGGDPFEWPADLRVREFPK